MWKEIDNYGFKYGTWNWLARVTVWARWRLLFLLNRGVIVVVVSVCCSSCRASTWLDKALMTWSKTSYLSPGSGASVFSSQTGDFSFMLPFLSGSSGPLQYFPMAAKSCWSFSVPQLEHLHVFLRLDLFFEDIALKRTVTSRSRFLFPLEVQKIE